MRVYFEKPRPIVGWIGLINDPDLDGSYYINEGVRRFPAAAVHRFHDGLHARFAVVVAAPLFPDDLHDYVA